MFYIFSAAMFKIKLIHAYILKPLLEHNRKNGSMQWGYIVTNPLITHEKWNPELI